MFDRVRYDFETDYNLINACYNMLTIREDVKWRAFAVREATALLALVNRKLHPENYQRIVEFVHDFMDEHFDDYFEIYPQDSHCMREWLSSHQRNWAEGNLVM